MKACFQELLCGSDVINESITLKQSYTVWVHCRLSIRTKNFDDEEIVDWSRLSFFLNHTWYLCIQATSWVREVNYNIKIPKSEEFTSLTFWTVYAKWDHVVILSVTISRDSIKESISCRLFVNLQKKDYFPAGSIGKWCLKDPNLQTCQRISICLILIVG